VAVVGGLVRDLLLDLVLDRVGVRRDLDLVVEGDGRALARGLAEALGGTVREHAAFQTATVTLADGGRVDVTTARREWYAEPGALPRVEPASLGEDLWRRDFAVNALAVRLDDPAWGEIVDATGGLRDLAARRIRVLHPCSFIEDPTRIFRAVRFAERLGFRLDPTTRRLLVAAATLAVYSALSGDRLFAELTLILAEPSPARVLGRLGRLGALRLLHPDYRFGTWAARRLAAVAEAVAALPLEPATVLGLHLLALSAHLDAPTADAWVGRWGVPLPTREAVGRARAEAPRLADGLSAARGPADAYRLLRSVGEPTAAWAWVLAVHPRVRRLIARHLREWRGLVPLLGGDDLKALGVTPGPVFGRLLAEARTAQVAGQVTSREQAAAWARHALAQLRRGEAANGSSPEPKGG
jgi:tRNA nucleotidyltransferase (CCA-adding enzyme)